MTDLEPQLVVAARRSAVVALELMYETNADGVRAVAALTLLRETADAIQCERARSAFWETVHGGVKKMIQKTPKVPEPVTVQPGRRHEDWQEALEVGDELLDALERLPASASAFAGGVRDAATNIMEIIKITRSVTVEHREYLNNLLAAASAEKWKT